MINENNIFVGRTKLNEDLELHEGLSVFQQSRIETLAHQVLIENKLGKLPIDLVEIIENRSWKLISFIEAKRKLSFLREYIDFKDWGYSMMLGNQFFILYDNTISIANQRFTIAHEIGHIVLNHNKYNRGKIRDEEANLFASHLLMPASVLKNSEVSSAGDISRMCGVNEYWAKIQLQRINNLNNVDLKTERYIKMLNKLFNSYIKKEKTNKI